MIWSEYSENWYKIGQQICGRVGGDGFSQAFLLNLHPIKVRPPTNGNEPLI